MSLPAKKTKILVIAGAPLELYLHSATALLLRRNNPRLQFDLLVSTKFYGTYKPADEIMNIYSNKFITELPGLSPSTRKFLQNFKRGLLFRRYLKSLPRDYDYCFIGSYNEFFANALYRWLPKSVKLVIFSTLANYTVSNKELAGKRANTLSLSFRVLDWFFGYARTEHKWSPETGRSISRRVTRLPSHKTYLIGDETDPKKAPSGTVLLPWPFAALTELFPKPAQSQRQILVSGERLPMYPGWGEKENQILKAVFDYLRKTFPAYRLIYRPRPGLTNLSLIKPLLSGFEIRQGDETMEELFAKERFEKVISIKSLVSKLATAYGMQGYILYPMFPMTEEYKKTMAENLFTDSKFVVRVKKLEDLKTEIVLPRIARNLQINYEKILS